MSKSEHIPTRETPTPGHVIVPHWTKGMDPDEDTHMYLWAPEWRVLTADDTPPHLPAFREPWTLAAIVDDEIVMLIPGSQVRAWIASDAPLQLSACFDLRKVTGHLPR